VSNYVVTGAAGFIGSHLTEALLAAGHTVTAVDCLTDSYDPARKRENAAAFPLIEADLAEAPLEPLVAGADGIFHLAGQPGVRPSWGKDFDVYLDRNIRTSQRLLEAVKGSPRLKQLVFASSSSVYGDTRDLPLREDSPTRPYSPYGVTKLAAEHL
jgi:nucleoside-diphosphate-sugar epimerase